MTVILPSPRLTGQREDLVEGLTVIQRRGDDALRPESPGPQLVHAHAGGHRVVAGPDPVVGCRGDYEPDPARTARRAAGDLPTHERHGAAVRFYALIPVNKNQIFFKSRDRLKCLDIFLSLSVVV